MHGGWIKLMIAAARLPLRSAPANSQFERSIKAGAAEEFLLSVQRQMVGEFGHHYVSQQACGRDAFVDHPSTDAWISVSQSRQTHLPRMWRSAVSTSGE